MTTGPKIPGVVIPRSVFTQPGSKSVVTVMSTARLLFHRKRKSIGGLAMSQECQSQTKTAHRDADDCRPLHLTLHRQEIGVAGQAPLTVETLLQNSERLASPSNRVAATWGYDHLDLISKVGPIANDLKLLNIACSLDLHVLHAG